MEIDLCKATVWAATRMELDLGVLRLQLLGSHCKSNRGTKYICFTYWVIIEAISPLAIIEGVCVRVLALFNGSKYVGCYQLSNKIRLSLLLMEAQF